MSGAHYLRSVPGSHQNVCPYELLNLHYQIKYDDDDDGNKRKNYKLFKVALFQ